MLNRRYITLACFIGFIILGLFNAQLGPTLPSVAAAVSLPLASAGIVRTARQLGIFAGVLGGGRLLDRRDARVVLFGGALLTVIGLLGMISTGRVELMLAASLILGIGSGLLDVGPNTLIPAIYAASASSMLVVLHMFVGVGAAVGPLVTDWAIEQRNDWRIAYVVTAIIVAALGVIYMGVRVNTKQQRIVESKANKLLSATSVAVRWGPLIPLILLIGLYNGAGVGVADWIYTHVQLVAQAEVSVGAQITSLFWISQTAGRILTIAALRRFSETVTLIVSLVIALIGAALIVMAGANVMLIAIGVVLVSAGFSPIYPLTMAFGGREQPQARGSVSGILAASAAFGGMTIPVLYGWIGAGQNGGMIITVIISVILLVIATLYVRRMKPIAVQ